MANKTYADGAKPLCSFCGSALEYQDWQGTPARSKWDCWTCGIEFEIYPFLPSEERKALVSDVPEVDSTRRVVKR